MLIKYPSPPPGRPGFVGLPQAEVRIAQASDGRWMWGISFLAGQGGEGFAPMEKWGRFADTCKRCGDRLRPGIAMRQTYTAGSPDLGECVTFSPGGPGRLVECRKCPACGWSMT